MACERYEPARSQKPFSASFKTEKLRGDRECTPTRQRLQWECFNSNSLYSRFDRCNFPAVAQEHQERSPPLPKIQK